MKKFLSILLSLTLLLSVLALPVWAVDAAAMYTETDDVELSAGDTFTYTVSLAGSYMGYACKIPVIDGLTVETITKSDTDVGRATNVDKKADGSYLLSVMPSFEAADAEKNPIVTVTAKVNDDAPLGTITLSLIEVQIANSTGVKVADLQTHFASVSVVEKTHEHSYGAWTKLDDEFHHRTCACGDEQKEAHRWDEGVVTTPATDTTPGVKTYTCAVCDGTKAEEIPVASEKSGKLSTVKSSPGKTVVIAFSLNNPISCGGFSLQKWEYNSSIMTLDYKNITISDSINPAVSNTKENGDIAMMFDGITELSGVIINVPFLISEEAADGNYNVTCQASYEDDGKITYIPVASGNVTIQKYTPGDVNGDNKVTSADVVQLMWHIFTPEDYPVTDQSHDYNKDGILTSADVIYLMWHIFSPKDYPLG